MFGRACGTPGHSPFLVCNPSLFCASEKHCFLGEFLPQSLFCAPGLCLTAPFEYLPYGTFTVVKSKKEGQKPHSRTPSIALLIRIGKKPRNIDGGIVDGYFATKNNGGRWGESGLKNNKYRWHISGAGSARANDGLNSEEACAAVRHEKGKGKKKMTKVASSGWESRLTSTRLTGPFSRDRRDR